MNSLSQEQMEYLIIRLLEKAKDAFEEAKENKGDAFYDGRRLAYYEMLDTLKNQLIVDDQDLSDLGLDISLESMAD